MTAAESDQTPSRRDTGGNFDGMIPESTGPTRPAVTRRQIGMLGLVLACAAGAGFASVRSGPQAASAAVAAAPAGSGQIGEFVARDADAARQIEQMLRESAPMRDGVRFSPQSTQVPVTELKTNPFRLALTGRRPVQLSGDLTESSTSEQQREAALQAVQSLQLQSILRGDSHRACLIDGVLYQEGDVVEGFVVEEIASNTVVVRKDVYRFELQLRK